MKKLTGTVKIPSISATKLPLSMGPSVPQVKVENLTDILQRIRDKNGDQLVTYDQSVALTGVKFKHSGETVLTLEDRYFDFEIANMLNDLEYEQVYNFLSTDWEIVFGGMHNIRSKMIFENPLMSPARDKFKLDMEIFRNKIDIEKGAVDCRRCGSEETLSVERQTRSADEPMTIRVRCLSCKYAWTAQ